MSFEIFMYVINLDLEFAFSMNSMQSSSYLVELDHS